MPPTQTTAPRMCRARASAVMASFSGWCQAVVSELFDLMLRSARSARLEAWAASPSFETRSFGPLLRMRLECVVDFPWRISSETSGDFFDLAARGRADHRLAHRGAVDDLFGWNGEGRSACGGARERLEGGAHDVELVGVPGLCRALHRLELADAELARA